jgi:hypothetical protein
MKYAYYFYLNFSQLQPLRGQRKKEFDVLIDICHDGLQVFKTSKAPKCTPLMGMYATSLSTDDDTI